MSNHIGIRKNLYFPEDEESLLDECKALASQRGEKFSPVVREILRYGIPLYIKANGIKRPFVQSEKVQ